jgi:nicotine blue oxidoreductase
VNTPDVAGIVLAAGEGRRLGMPKALVELQGELLVDRAASLLIDAGCSPVVVVLGASAGDVKDRAGLAGVEVIVNADWRSGVGSSLRAGLGAVRGRAHGAVILLADQAGMTVDAVRTVIEVWRASARPAATASFAGQPGPPVVLAAEVWDAVADDATDDRGARAWLRRHVEEVTVVACDGLADPLDIDTPEDLAAARKRPSP